MEKPISQFTKDKRRKHGIGGMCKPCKNSQDFRANPELRPQREKRDPDIDYLSLGAGVQSSTILMMCEKGELPPIEFAVFADTQWEPQSVYDNLEWLESHTSIPIVRVTAGSVRDSEFPAMPLFAEGGGMLHRQCTGQFKIKPIRSYLYERVQKRTASTRVRQWLGISLDESVRMKDTNVLWIENYYPLVELGLTREDCIAWMLEQGYPEPPKSACVACPYRSGQEWRDLSPVEWTDATSFDDNLRRDGRTIYVHSSITPLRSAELDNEGAWANECEGHCGI